MNFKYFYITVVYCQSQAAITSSGVLSFDSRKYPPGFQVPNLQFSRNYNINSAPNIPVSFPYRHNAPPQNACANSVSACSWSCNQCLRDTDIFTCKDRLDWGLSFDDGPSPATLELLKYLKEKQIKASFFVVGSQVLRYPDILRQQYLDGHQIVIHTWSHRALTTLTNEEIVSELEWTAIIIQDIIGYRPKYFRPPFGDLDDRVRYVAGVMGLKPILWNYDTGDWALFNSTMFESQPSNATRATADLIVENARRRSGTWFRNNAGVISLEHDISPASAIQGPKVTEAIVNGGMTVKTVAACIGDSNPYVRPSEIETVSINYNSIINGTDSGSNEKNGGFCTRYNLALILIAITFII